MEPVILDAAACFVEMSVSTIGITRNNCAEDPERLKRLRQLDGEEDFALVLESTESR